MIVLGGDSSYRLTNIAAHMFLEPFTPPVPLAISLVVSGLVVIASFALIGYFSSNSRQSLPYPKLNLSKWNFVNYIAHPHVASSTRFISVFLYFLVCLTGLLGSDDPLHNWAPTFVWVIWWVGVVYVSALIGDIWRLVNPWAIVFMWIERFLGYATGNSRYSPVLKYPEKLSYWPAVFLLLAFGWIENVYQDSLVPSRIAQMILFYSIFTWFGMFLFGRDTWLRKGEVFSIVFSLLAKCSIIEVARVNQKCGHQVRKSKLPSSSESLERNFGWINLRPFGFGLLDSRRASISKMVFVLVLLGTVTFDGFSGTTSWKTVQLGIQNLVNNLVLIDSFGLILTSLIFITSYLVICALVSQICGRTIDVLNLACTFINTLIPIALAYHVAHFLVFLLIQGQLIVPLMSDPFGVGWDIFGTTDYRVNLTLIRPEIYWFVSVSAILIGHILAVYLSHKVALEVFPTRREALVSQFPMLVLMVGYTVGSLWILTQPMYVVR